MKNLWAPWRMKYIKDEYSKPQGCVFCQKLEQKKDKENFILFRGETAFIIMNLYPYNNGHLMVIPNRHISDFISLTEEETKEITSLLKKSSIALTKTMNPQGFNIGLNLGRVAGAGIAEHIHWHIVPRWEADTNFMPVVNNVTVIPQALEESYNLLKRNF